MLIYEGNVNWCGHHRIDAGREIPLRTSSFAKASADRSDTTKLNLGRGPELVEGAWPTSVGNAVPSRVRHAVPQRSIRHQSSNRVCEVFDVMRPGDQTVCLVCHQFLRAAGIGNDNRQSGRLCFEDYVAESVCGAGKNKDVGRCICGSQFFAAR